MIANCKAWYKLQQSRGRDMVYLCTYGKQLNKRRPQLAGGTVYNIRQPLLRPALSQTKSQEGAVTSCYAAVHIRLFKKNHSGGLCQSSR